MTRQEIADAIVDTLKGVLASRDATIAALAERLAAIEQKPHVKFCGTWQPGALHEPGDAVVRSGGLWVCVKPTSGEQWDHGAWQLAVKRGSV